MPQCYIPCTTGLWHRGRLFPGAVGSSRSSALVAFISCFEVPLRWYPWTPLGCLCGQPVLAGRECTLPQSELCWPCQSWHGGWVQETELGEGHSLCQAILGVLAALSRIHSGFGAFLGVGCPGIPRAAGRKAGSGCGCIPCAQVTLIHPAAGSWDTDPCSRWVFTFWVTMCFSFNH